MSKWVEFTKDYDHRWPSRATSAFKAGSKVFVKDEVVAAAEAKGAVKILPGKPDDADLDRQKVAPGNSLLLARAQGLIPNAPPPEAPPADEPKPMPLPEDDA